MKRIFFYFLIALTLQNCARIGKPTGGPKDQDAPIIIQTFPKFNTTEFNKKEIKIYFDEYVKIKDLQKQLVVSPPLKYPAVISPQGIPTKRITIKIKDTLKPNATYVLNFGNSIEDNNEGNVLKDFKYVFSTGKQIDTLNLVGNVKDAFNQKQENFISVMLYKVNRYNDSIVYTKKPNYVTSTLDSTSFNLSNLKKGKYRIIALKEKNKDYQYQPKDEKIAFIDSIISLPTDKNIELKLFKEEPQFKVKEITEIAKGHLLIGFVGDPKNSKIEIVKIDSLPFNKVTDFKSYTYKDKKTDSIHYFYNYKKTDSIKFRISKDTIRQEIVVKTNLQKTDSLLLKANTKGTLHPLDTLKIISTIPIKKTDKNKFQFMQSDSIPITFALHQKRVNELEVLFDKKPKSRYKLMVLPNGITSIFNQTNDTLNIGFQTKKDTYYSSITLNIQTKKTPLIVQLLDSKNRIVRTHYLVNKTKTLFDKLIPQKYRIRIIYDLNKNKKWDSGNFLKHQQPEPVYYFNKSIDLKENWFLNETMQLP